MKNSIIFIFIVTLSSMMCQKNLDSKIYPLHRIGQDMIKIDGVLREPEWQKAVIEKAFSFPWENNTAPTTEFRALYDDDYLYFSFNVVDDEIVVADSIENEKGLIDEDRVEIYFTLDEQLKEYYCIEIDPHGRVLDYSASFHRQFDFSWEWENVVTGGTRTDAGYIVEGVFPLQTLKSLGLPVNNGDTMLRAAVFRAQFHRDSDGKIEEHWLSWQDPSVDEPDFHCIGISKLSQKNKETADFTDVAD